MADTDYGTDSAGRVITEQQVEAWAAEAEAGYGSDRLAGRRVPGRWAGYRIPEGWDKLTGGDESDWLGA
jgi:hypothetical protein